MQNLNKNKGFTLIEIMAVLIILAVLATIVVPKFINMDKTAIETQIKYNDNAVRRIATGEYYFLEDKTETLEEYIQRRIEEERAKK